MSKQTKTYQLHYVYWSIYEFGGAGPCLKKVDVSSPERATQLWEQLSTDLNVYNGITYPHSPRLITKIIEAL